MKRMGLSFAWNVVAGPTPMVKRLGSKITSVLAGQTMKRWNSLLIGLQWTESVPIIETFEERNEIAQSVGDFVILGWVSSFLCCQVDLWHSPFEDSNDVMMEIQMAYAFKNLRTMWYSASKNLRTMWYRWYWNATKALSFVDLAIFFNTCHEVCQASNWAFHSQIICDSEKLMYPQGVAMSVPGASIMRNVPRPSDMLLDVEVFEGCVCHLPGGSSCRWWWFGGSWSVFWLRGFDEITGYLHGS